MALEDRGSLGDQGTEQPGDARGGEGQDEHHQHRLAQEGVLGERPRTAAFGWNGELNVLQVRRLLDIERFRRVDVDATSPDRLYADRGDLAADRNTGFLEACAKRLPCVNFVDAESGRIWLCIERGVPVWADAAGLAEALYDPQVRAGIAAVAPNAIADRLPAPPAPVLLHEQLGRERIHTLGHWGPVA